MTNITNPFPYFPEAGTGGFIYVGTANLDARTNPITVYRDEAQTLPWAQPIRTVNGYPAYQGAQSSIYAVPATASITVLDSRGKVLVNETSVTNADLTLRADLASNAASKGASLVGRFGGGTVEQALIPDSYTVSLPYDANTFTGTGTNGAPALQALADTKAPEVKLVAFYDFATPTTGSTLLGGTVTIPTRQQWKGAGAETKLVVDVNDPKPNGYILLGANTAYQSAQPYDLFVKSFGGVYLDARAADGNAKSPVGIVVGGPVWRVHDIYALSLQTVVRGADTGVTNGSGASVTATVAGGAVTGFTGLVGGSGYINGALISFSGGGGTGAVAVATVTGGVITAITVFNGGTGYTSAPTVTISNPGVDPHADHLLITNVHLNSQPNPVDFDPLNPGNSRYGIDWLRTQAGADSAVIERCQSDPTGTLVSGTAKRCRFIGLRNFTSVSIRHIINGDVYLYQCTGEVSNSYFEFGVISNLQSEMTVRNCQFFMRNEVTCGADIGAVPIKFLATPLAVAGGSTVPSSMTLRECSFNYDAVGSGSTPGNIIAVGGYSLTNPNFSIGAGIYGTMTVKNCWRAGPYTNGRGWYQRLGITCGMADFDNYSHFASVDSFFVGSGTGGERWNISAQRGPVSVTSATSLNGLESVSFDSGYKGPFKGATATYYYRVAILHDKIRRIGILGGLEVSQAATNGATGAVNLRLGFDIPGGGFIARVYRGTSTGVYDNYVDVPVIEAGRLYDNGEDLSSFAWISRTPGAADAVNANISAGIEIGPGEITTASDAYGRAVIWSTATTMPTLGGWRRGDEVRYATGRWQRLTNCTSAAPAHVLNTDWKQVTY
jgi:hypothetical protein